MSQRKEFRRKASSDENERVLCTELTKSSKLSAACRNGVEVVRIASAMEAPWLGIASQTSEFHDDDTHSYYHIYLLRCSFEQEQSLCQWQCLCLLALSLL